MQTYRADRVVRVLSTLVSIAYFGLWSLGVTLLVCAPAAKLISAGRNWIWQVEFPANLPDPATTVQTTWGPALFVVREVRGRLQFPVGLLPWRLFAVLWVHVAVVLGLTLLSLHHLRQIFRRVQDGAPFDADNALRMRTLGLLLLALAVFNGIATLVTTLALRAELSGGPVSVASGLHFNLPLVFAALVLVVLAEIFRRGSELEREQALVI